MKNIIIQTNQKTYDWLKQHKHNYSWKTLLIIGAKIIDKIILKNKGRISEFKLPEETDKIIKEILGETPEITKIEATRKGKPEPTHTKRQNVEDVLIRW